MARRSSWQSSCELAEAHAIGITNQIAALTKTYANDHVYKNILLGVIEEKLEKISESIKPKP